jgi:peptidoglycan hydrolase CwlO-like protein
MFFEWTMLTIVVFIATYLFVKMFYFKNLNHKEKRQNDLMKITLEEAEILIRKYQLQLQRALGNIDILTEELSKLRCEMKTLKSRNAQQRVEIDRSKKQIKDLETRIEALL